MTNKKYTLGLAILTFAFGCEEYNLQKVCPAPKDLSPCIQKENGYDKLTSAQAANYNRCSIGQEVCDDFGNLSCVLNQKVPEIGCNGIDDDCDGDIDENQNPSLPEICDGLDNNCNGVTDELSPVFCWDGSENAVFNDEYMLSTCSLGISECIDGEWTGCVGQVLDEPEICDGLDNDCDGFVDNLNDECGPPTNVGQCEYGFSVCSENEMFCVGAVDPQAEICDGVDNDCDGEVDEFIFQTCETQCEVGIETCSNGQFVGCTARLPSAEICDDIDNDCDGEVDEGCSCVDGDVQTCTNNIINQDGESVTCGLGVQTCHSGEWGACLFNGIFPETCNNHDDDCDGVVDEIEAVCGSGEGACISGTQVCSEGVWSECNNIPSNEPEVCDGRDNDCDGEVDEGLRPYDKVDLCFLIDISGSMEEHLSNIQDGIRRYLINMQNTEHRFCIIAYPYYGPAPSYRLISDGLVTSDQLMASLQNLNFLGAPLENTYDVLYDAMHIENRIGIPWRSDAQPYLVTITDERPQTNNNVVQSDLRPLVENCQIGGCDQGDFVETFVITSPDYRYFYFGVVRGEMSRVKNLFPSDPEHYSNIFNEILSNVCVYSD